MTLLAPLAPVDLSSRETAIELLERVAPKPPRYRWRSNEHIRPWKPFTTRGEAEALFASRSDDDPWATLERQHSDAAGPSDWDRNTYVQVLYDQPHRVCISGGIRRGSHDRAWTSSVRGVPQGPVTTVGPSWCLETLFTAQVQTVHDALLQMWPALHLDHPDEYAIPGYRLRDWNLDPEGPSARG